METQGTSALILYSGGQDSATALAWACNQWDYVETVGFYYGQRHDVEMSCRAQVLKSIKEEFPGWAVKIGPDYVIELTGLDSLGETAMTHDIEISFNEAGLPNTFVPGRNLIFLNYAGALGYRRYISDLVGGMCEADFSGYPDCRKEALDAAVISLSLGMNRAFTLHTPLMTLSKAGAWKLAHDLGGDKLVDLIVEETHTCYLGQRDKRHGWGYGCGTCPACILRAKGWENYQGGTYNR